MCDVYVCMHKHVRLGGSGSIAPRKFFATEAILGQKQSRSRYMACRVVLHPILGCPCICKAS